MLALTLIQLLKKMELPERVNLASDSMCFCYSDIDGHNFLIKSKPDATEVEPDDLIYVVDFGTSCFLPTSFMSLTLHSPENYFAAEIAKIVAYPVSGNFEAMSNVLHHFHLTEQNRDGMDQPSRHITGH